MQTANTNFQPAQTPSYAAGVVNSFRTTSLDPVVSDVHAIRDQQWAKYGDDSQAWFDDLLKHQAQRTKLTTA
jgi:hypothetical protein